MCACVYVYTSVKVFGFACVCIMHVYARDVCVLVHVGVCIQVYDVHVCMWLAHLCTQVL